MPELRLCKKRVAVAPLLDGDRVLIDRSTFRYRPPRRWEIAAFQRAGEAEKILIKRIVGLPGESVQIRNGNVYINGQIQRKTLAQQRSMAVLVYDANYSSTLNPLPPKRWQSEKADSHWSSAGGRFTCQNRTDKNDNTAIDWLIYRHWRRLADQRSGTEQCPIADLTPYNQSLPRREEDVHAVSDLLLSFRLANASGPGTFFIRANIDKNVLQIEIDPRERQYRATLNGSGILQKDVHLPFDVKGMEVVVSSIDEQFMLAFNGREVLCLPIDTPDPHGEMTSEPFALGVKELGIQVDNLRIYRDVYYSKPIGFRARWALQEPLELGEHEYFVLGDNSPIADDSRTWPVQPAVVDNLLIGKPFFIFLPAKSVWLGQWHFQVPDPGRIGYIR